ncbi:uncharacterized protein [Arachis hypogaea]|uniref:uncharacterized protein n=1 Tax=Arachis hypogaea TaxID=3818 RepID=UPI003B21D487
MADKSWVASKLIKRLLIHPEMKPRQAMDYMTEEYNVQLNPRMIARALKVAREVVVGNARAQYEKIRDYLMEIHRSNPRSTALMETIPQHCLIGYYGGQLLSAVGQDANNHFFVIAYAVGLDLAIKEVMPNAHHRNCVLHIWKNFIKHFKDQQTKQMVCECARCTTFQEFNRCMEKMKTINLGAWEYLQRFDPAVWTKAYFSHGPKVDNITKNMCKVWNAKIVEYLEKPILTMCEDLRCYLMRKMTTHKKNLENHSGHLAPVQQKKLDEFVKPKANKWRAIWARDNDRVLFEVHRGTSKVGVNLQQRICTCNVWNLLDGGSNVNLNNDNVQPAPPMDPLRREHLIVRPPTAPISVPPSFGLSTPPPVQAALGLRPYVPTEQNVNPRTTTTNVPFQQSVISAETMAAASSGTATRLFKFIPTPGFRPPRNN